MASFRNVALIGTTKVRRVCVCAARARGRRWRTRPPRTAALPAGRPRAKSGQPPLPLRSPTPALIPRTPLPLHLQRDGVFTTGADSCEWREAGLDGARSNPIVVRSGCCAWPCGCLGVAAAVGVGVESSCCGFVAWCGWPLPVVWCSGCRRAGDCVRGRGCRRTCSCL